MFFLLKINCNTLEIKAIEKYFYILCYCFYNKMIQQTCLKSITVSGIISIYAIPKPGEFWIPKSIHSLKVSKFMWTGNIKVIEQVFAFGNLSQCENSKDGSIEKPRNGIWSVPVPKDNSSFKVISALPSEIMNNMQLETVILYLKTR